MYLFIFEERRDVFRKRRNAWQNLIIQCGVNYIHFTYLYTFYLFGVTTISKPKF